jgi:hypothetical protein
MTAVISLDMKKKRIRIHKSTLELLDNPTNIVILINPDKYKIMIRPVLPDVKDSLKVIYKTNADCEFYSKELMDQLSKLGSCINLSYTYRITGKAVPGKGIALFDINDAVRYGMPTDLEQKSRSEADDK